jgi:hypothetical protein
MLFLRPCDEFLAGFEGLVLAVIFNQFKGVL